MTTHTFTADEATGQSIFNDLHKYMEQNVLNGNRKFICQHESQCRKSAENEGREFHPGQLHHVGPLYDLKRNGKPFRIVVSGAEYGPDDKCTSMKLRTSGINDLHPGNPHMRGTLCLLQLLFGETPRNSDKEKPDSTQVTINNEKHSIFRAFSLANFLLCAASKDGSSYNASTAEMQKNCQSHFQKTLEILQPQILVLQGMRSQNYFWNDTTNTSISKVQKSIQSRLAATQF